MRNVVLYHLMSLDGVAYEEPGDWLGDEGDHLIDYLGRVISTQDDVLMGRGNYDYWVKHWPASDFEPFAPFINGVRKHVFTSSALTADWANTIVVDRPAIDYVADLKQGPGADIGVHGSLGLARSLMRAGLIDRLRLVVAPAVVGQGRRAFEAEDTVRSWALTGVEQGRNGTLFLDYSRK
ncbi:dihydrofolate reductase family protein [Nonomuraea sp. NPDC050328]|uniref:dihydrofolate reductase family protein n=1 Tax=Nonomuraea sp. NPDC050328 TaxID=3364361 RepID=UPI0037A6736C